MGFFPLFFLSLFLTFLFFLPFFFLPSFFFFFFCNKWQAGRQQHPSPLPFASARQGSHPGRAGLAAAPGDRPGTGPPRGGPERGQGRGWGRGAQGAGRAAVCVCRVYMHGGARRRGCIVGCAERPGMHTYMCGERGVYRRGVQGVCAPVQAGAAPLAHRGSAYIYRYLYLYLDTCVCWEKVVHCVSVCVCAVGLCSRAYVCAHTG